MFRRALHLARLPFLVCAASYSLQARRPTLAQPTDEEIWMYEAMRRVMFAEKVREVVIPLQKDEGQKVIILYGRRLLTSKDFQEKLIKGTASARRMGYEVTKHFVDSVEDIPSLAAELKISDKELKDRLDNQAAVFFRDGKRTLSLPANIGISEIDSWVEKCQHPSITPKDQSQYYYLARKVIKSEDSYMVLSVDTSPEDLLILKSISMGLVHVPLLEIPNTLAEELGLTKGVYVSRMYSRMDGEKDVTKLGMLQYFKFDGAVTDAEAFYKWMTTVRQPLIGYLSDPDKLYPHLVRLHSGARRCLFVLTSQLNHHSKRYQQLLDSLIRLQTEYKDSLIVTIVPSDLIASKLSIVRDKKMRRMRLPEARFVDYNTLIGTEQKEDGSFPVIDCKAEHENCANISDTHYVRKTAFKGEEMNYDQLKHFLDTSFSGSTPHFYESKPLPLRNAKKLNAANFRQEVLDSPEDVLLEIYGKYCPGCRAFAPKLDLFAGEMKEFKGKLRVVKVCSDFNFIPELSEKKPFTPIFWYYKAGGKTEPVKFEGANKVEELREFVKKNATFQIPNPS